MRRALGATLVGVAAAALVLSVAASASAHNYVESSTPADGEVLTGLPAEFVVTTNDRFVETGSLGAFALYARDAEGLYYGDSCVTITGRSMAVPAALGEPGPYQLVYQFVSADGHTVAGELSFEWAPTDASGFEPAVGSANPTRCGETPGSGEPAPVASGSDDATLDLNADLLWAVGAVVAVVVAVAVTTLALRARRQV